MNLLDYAEQAGLDIISEAEICLDGCQFKYVKANRNIRQIKYHCISQFYLVNLTIDNLPYLKDYQKFRILQKEILSAAFFELKNDMRWNIYLLFIFDGTYSELANVPVHDIEADEDYARKYFFNIEDGQLFFHKDKFFNTNKQSSPVNPVKDWVDKLEKVELTGILSETYLVKNVMSYIEGSPFNSTETFFFSDESETNGIKATLKHIDTVSLGGFRSHCFGDSITLSPRLINLIHGVNGSGKTSLLEGIELALTNEIKRLKDFNEKFSSLPEVNISMSSSNETTQTISSKKPNAKCKELDKDWYGTPLGREKSTLNGNYNLFNSFNSETAYKFALDESKQDTDYTDTLTKLLYDDSILAMDKLWFQKYRNEFITQSMNLDKELAEKQLELSKIETEVQEYNYVENYDKIIELLQKIGCKISEVENTLLYYEKIGQTINATQDILINFRPIWEKYNFKCFDDFIEYKNKIELDIGIATVLLDQKQSEKLSLESNAKKLKLKISELQNQRATNEVLEQGLNKSLYEWNTNKIVISQPRLVSDYKSLKQKEYALSITSKALFTLQSKYLKLHNLTPNDLEVDVAEYDNIISMLEDKHGQLKNINIQIENASTKIGQIKRLKIQLSSLGAQVLQLSEDKNICPLCKVRHKSDTSLLNLISNAEDFTYEDKILSGLENNKNELYQEIELWQNKQEAIKSCISNMKMLNDFLLDTSHYDCIPQQGNISGLEYAKNILIMSGNIQERYYSSWQSDKNITE